LLFIKLIGKIELSNKGGTEMLNTKNLDAETAYAMALKLVDAPQGELAQRIWDKCHADQSVQKLVSLYLSSSFAYAPKALHKLHGRLVEIVEEVR
jgi:hypothetical protein